jgi:predicted ATPase/class 3 adenylate cyclase
VSAVQPAGTVTLVFTDIAGSTRLLETVGTQAYRTAFEEHRTVVRRAFAAHGGYEVDNEGDGFFYAFSSAQSAVSAVREAMAALEAGPIRVRVGIHTGEPAVDPPKYVGIDVHRAARIMGAAHGGQVLLSPSTVSLLEPASFELRDLGEHRLKDLRAPERLFQLGETPFPPLRSLHRTNLPVPATPFVGREAELAALRGLLLEPDVRLVSLTGAGGMGKTRLALQAAAEASDDFPDGVFWIPLAPLRDPALVLPACAEALSVAQDQAGAPVDDLARGLAGRRLLVFIDNVEHLLPAAADAVVAFVTACPTVTVVVTSRERLRVPGERVYAVPALSESDGEALFRMRAASAGVELQASAEVRTLCARLDNLPLALELAAARTVVFSPEQLLDRLAQRLDLLRAGGHVDARQQTLRATIAWSHELLDPEEQCLFRRMSVFAGSCSFESAEQIAGADPDVLQSLLDKNLLRRRDGARARRFWMLETIREFASERLAAAGEDDDVQRRHLEHYAALAESCFDETLLGNDDLELLEDERENLRLALDFALRSDPELAISLARWLMPSWVQRGEYFEGRERLRAALAGAPDASGQARAWALRAAAQLAVQQSDHDVAEALGGEALALFRELGDQRGTAWTLNVLAWSAMGRGADYGRARLLFEQAADAHRATGDERLEHAALSSLAMVASAERDVPRAVSLNRSLVATARREGSTRSLGLALNNLGGALEMAGDDEQARLAYEESAALSRQIANKPLLALTLCNLGYVMWATAPTDALAHFRESLELSREVESPRTIAYCLEGTARIFLEHGSAMHAAGLLGAASEIRLRTGSASSPGRRATTADFEARCRAALSTDAFARAWDEGAALDARSAADWALRLWDDTQVS